MAEKLKVYLKCCCGSEISVEVDEYKRSWVDQQLEKFTALHKDCPEKMTRKHTEYIQGFKPGLYATNAPGTYPSAPVSNSGPDLNSATATSETWVGAPFWTDPTGKKIPY